MKDFIYINYNVLVDKIYSNYFFINDEKILIVKYNKDIKTLDYLVELSNIIYSKKVYVDTFILNKEGKYYTKRNNEYIILLKVNDREKEITLDYLKSFNNIENKLEKINIIDIWKEEIDSLEAKLTEFNKEYKLIQDSFNYFIGVSENAIQLMNEYDEYDSNDICHKTEFNKYNRDVFNNPFTFIKVNKMYDISNYIKYKFYNKTLDYEELYEILINIDNEYEEAFLFASLMYQNYYFETVNKIIKEECDEEILKKLIDNSKQYEKLLSFCQMYTKKSKYIKLINWFNE